MATGPIDERHIGTHRRRGGCLGCLGKLLGYLVVYLALGSLLLCAIDAVFAPWSFFMGGRFHPIPMWRGWGKLHSASGRDYVLYIWFEPARGYRGVAHVLGWGTLCTPRGESYSVRASGYMEKFMGASTDGKRMDLSVYRRPWYWGWTGKWDRRPQLELRGAWHNPDLVLNDGGSLDRAFNSDGTLHSGPTRYQKPGERGVQLTLHEGTKSEFAAACTDIQGH
jgi:hypothetical protein